MIAVLLNLWAAVQLSRKAYRHGRGTPDAGNWWLRCALWLLVFIIMGALGTLTQDSRQAIEPALIVVVAMARTLLASSIAGVCWLIGRIKRQTTLTAPPKIHSL